MTGSAALLSERDTWFRSAAKVYFGSIMTIYKTNL